MDYAKLLKAAAVYIRAELKKDAGNLYSLKEDWILPPVRAKLPDFSDDAFDVIGVGDNSVILVKAFESTPDNPVCDGASMAPDKIMGVDFVAASIFHDRWYGHLEILADAWGMSVAEVRKIGDRVFASIALAENEGRTAAVLLATVYYRAVRAFGGFYHRHGHRIRTAVTALALALLLTGCSAGCATSIFDDDGGYQPPKWEKVENGD